jgi:opacity protein-like surface antigen
MKRLLLAGLLIVVLVPAVLADEAPTGVNASLLLGMNMCMDSGDAKCDNVDPSFGFLVSGGYRFHQYVGANLDIHYGMYGPEEGSASTLGFMVGPKGYLPLGDISIFANVGFGYVMHMASNGADVSQNGLALGFGAGAEYMIMEGLGLGLGFKYWMTFEAEACVDAGSGEMCGDADSADEIMLGLNATYYF